MHLPATQSSRAIAHPVHVGFAMDQLNRSFRWNIAKREQLGRLVVGEPVLPSVHFLPTLRACAAHVVAFAANADLIFVGRSPENLFDYMSGMFMGTSWAERCTLLPISLRVNAKAPLRHVYPAALAAGYDLLAAYTLAPDQILHRPRPIAFIDLVASGETFGHLATVLVERAHAQQVDVPALKQKLRFIGLTWRTKTSPNTWRWQQHHPWTTRFAHHQIKNGSIPAWLWAYWGNE